MLDLNIHISDEQIKHIEESTNKKTLFRRFKSISHISNPKLAQYIQDNCDTSNVKKCGFCGSVSNIIDYDLKFVNNRIFLDNIKYSNQKLICSRKDTDVTKNCRNHALNNNSTEFVRVSLGLSTDEEALEYIHERNSTPFYACNHESVGKYKESQRRDEKYYGSEERYKAVLDKIGANTSKAGLIKRHGKAKAYQICKSRDSTSTKYFKNKYGDSWEKHFNEKCQKSISFTLNKFIEKHGIEDGTVLFEEVKNRASEKRLEMIYSMTKEERSKIYGTTSKRFHKAKYGDSWEKHYYEHHRKISVSVAKASKESLCFFNKLLDKISHLNLNYNLGVDDNSEWFIYDKENKKFNLYDFCIKELNVIIEYHGSLWHYNPNYEYKGNLPFGMTVEKNIEKDMYKRELAVYNGFKYFVVFDTDDYEQKTNELAKIIEGLANERTV